jgi:translocation and assembly module TamB
MLSEKRLRIARAAVSTAESTITVAGELGLEAKITGKLDYRVGVADVSPWLSLIDRKGSGSVNLTGQARGNLADLRTEGSARMSGLRLDGVLLRDGNVKFALQGSQGHWFPAGVVTARLAGVDAGLSLRRIDATAKLARQPSPSIEISLAAQDLQERKHALNGTVGIAADAITLRLSQAALASPVGTWTLAQAATITKRDQDFFIERLSLRNGEREVSLDGRFGFTGEQDLTLSVERFSLETLAAFFPQQPKMTGLLGAQARITGSAAAPEMTALARLSDASIAGQAYAGASADLQYKDKRASLRLVVQQDATHALTGAGSLPLALSWQNGWRAEPGDGMDFRIRSDGISLAFLNAFSDKSVANIAGEMSLDALARGSIKQPAIQGTFRLRDGRVKILPLGIEVTAIGAEGNLDSRNLVLREISARAKDGEIRGSGSLALNGYDVSAVKLSLKAQRWPAIETERYQVKLAGNVDVQGSLTAPQVTGNLTVTEGSLRPDLAFLDQSKVPLKRDETIVVIKNKQIVGESALQAAKSNTAADSGLLKNVTLDLNVRAPGNLWIRHPDMVAELSGNIQAKKTPQRELDLIGRIEIVRGWMGFQGRRFQLVRGAIEFTGGGKINPSLDIVAQYRVQDYAVEATVSGTSEKPTLTLASQPRLEQADILALLIFGRPLNALNKEEQGSLQQSALSLTSGFVAAGIAKSVSQAIGLDSLGLDIGDVDFGGGRVGFGRYVGSGTYVSASQQLSGEQGREVSAEYRITPDWKLSTSTTSTGSSGIDIIWHKRY